MLMLSVISCKRLRGYVSTGLLLFVKTILKSRYRGQRKSRANKICLYIIDNAKLLILLRFL